MPASVKSVARSRQFFFLAVLGLAVALAGGRPPRAATYEIVHAFSGDSSNSSSGLLQAPDGRLYGAITDGGQYGRGAIFAADRQPDGSLIVTTLHEFTGPDGDGVFGELVVGPDGRLYGVAANGGTNNAGTVFAFDPGTQALQVLHSMALATGNPSGGLVTGSDGALYGTSGGTTAVFRIETTGNFQVIATLDHASQGSNFRAPLVEGADGAFYGTTTAGGSNGFGTFVRVTIGGAVSVLYAFTSANGSARSGVTLASDSLFYGTTNTGGTSGQGVFFSVTAAGGFNILHNFTSATGASPQARPIEATDGLLYGTTRSGGASGRGVVYRIGKGGSPAYAVVQALNASAGQGSDAELLQTTAGDFYGTTTDGFSDQGGIFRLPPSTDSIARVHTFPRSAIHSPIGLTDAGDGSFFGTTTSGGSLRFGTVYRVTAAGLVSLLQSFASGATPSSPPLLAADGRLYGTSTGGRIIYRINADGTGYTQLHTLGLNSGSPNGRLMQAANGTIYGTATVNGATNNGLVFTISPAGVVNVIHQFPGGAGGLRPTAEVLEASDGFFYGTTAGDDTTSLGTIYRIDALGVVSTVHQFTGTDGRRPIGGLVEGPDGNIYGTTEGGGAFQNGVLFRLSNGVVTKITDFSNATTGAFPRTTLARGRDGRLYGTTPSGGALTGGTLFRLNTRTGQLRVLHNFPSEDRPSSELLDPPTDAGLIGVGPIGPRSGGVIYRYIPDRPPVAVADTFSATEDTPLTISAPGVLGNDTDDGAFTATLVTPTPVTHGNVALNSDGSFTFTPAANFHGTTSFTYSAADTLDVSDPVTVTIQVTPVNDAPTVANQSITTDEDTATGGVVGWTDVDDTSVTFRIGANGTRGTAAIDANTGAFTYTPNANAHGSDAFTVIANDGEADSNAATISVVINPINDAPTAAPQSVSTPEDVAKPIALAGADIDGDTLTFALATPPSKGTIVMIGNGVNYTPLANFHGSDTFTFIVSDGQLSSAAAVTITVTPVNDAPIAAPQTISTVEDRPVAFTLWASDVEGQSLTYTIVTSPANGSLSGAAPNYTYTPTGNFRGSDSFAFKVNDGALDSATATVTINVTGEQFVLASPEGSSVQALTVNPVNSSILYAGVQRGFFRSTDGGATWHRSTFRGEVSSIAVHPTTPTTLYSAGFDFGRVRRSTDGGATWQSLNAPGGRQLLIDPSRPDTIYAFASEPNAVSKTTNGGASWTSSGTGLSASGQIIVSGAAIDPALPSRLFVSLVNGGGVFRSDDAAASWQRVAFAGISVSDVDVDPRGNSMVYAVAGGRIRRSPNAGDTWSDVHTGITGSAVRAGVGPDGVVYVTTSLGTVWVSATGGGSWVRHTNTLPATVHTVLLADPSPAGTVHVADAAHLYKSTDATQTWTVADSGLVSSTPSAALVSQPDPQVVFAATSAGIFKSSSGGSSWNTALGVTSRAVAALAQDPSDPLVVYMGESDNRQVHRTLDGGATWTTHNSGLGPNATIFSLTVDTAGVVYAGAGTGGVYKSLDQGASWTQASNGLPSASVYALVATNTPAAVLYAGTTNGLFRSADGAASWQPLTSGISGFVRSIAVDPSDPSVVYAVVLGTGFGAYKSVNGGDSWTRLTLSLGSADFTAIVVDPANPSTVYAATTGAQGLARSTNGGVTWQTMTDGLPLTEVVSLAVGSDSSLYAGLLTAGLWKYVRAANDAPVAQTQNVTTAEDTAVAIALGASDPDAEPLTFTIVGGPSHGTLSGSGASRTYTPPPNYHGPDSFTFTASDGQATSAPAMVSITVTPVNDAPVALNDAFSTAEDTPATIRPVDNDSDAEPGPIVITAFTQPANGTVTQPGTHTLLYTPAANFFGVNTFTYTITDGGGLTATATIEMTVTPVNDAPIATPLAVTTAEDTPVSATLVSADVDGPAPTYAIALQPLRGRVTLNATTGAFTYTPHANATGEDSFSYTAHDGSLASNVAAVTVTISAANDTPEAHGLALVVLEDRAKALTLPASDPDSAAITFTIVSPPVHGTLSGSAPNLVYTPAANYNGPDSFTFSAFDGVATSSLATVSVDVAREVWDVTGPDTGYVVHLAYHPAAPSVVFARSEATAWKSVDDGESWTALRPGIRTSTLVADQRSPLVLYASGGSGVSKSTDGGATWVVQSSGLPPGGLQTLVFDPLTDAIYANTNAGLFRSTNAAASWVRIGTVSGFQLLWVDPVVSSRLYARINGALWKSLDGGVTWMSIQAAVGAVVNNLAIDPTAPDTLYAATSGSGVHKSVDGGVTWTPQNSGLNATFVFQIGMHPSAPGTLWAVGDSGLVYKTTNGAATWTPLAVGNGARGLISIGTHPSQSAAVLVGGSTGVFRSSNGGATWSKSNAGISAGIVQATAAVPSSGSFFAGSYYGGIYRSDMGTWSQLFSTDGLVTMAVDPLMSSRALTGHTCSGLARTIDSGATWSFVNTGFSSSCVMAVAFHPATAGVAYAGLSNGWIYRSLDGGATWSFLSTVPSSNVFDIVFDPSTPSTMFSSSNLAVFKSLDAGATWTQSSSGFSNLRALVIDPLDGDILYAAGVSGGVFRTLDGGTTWTNAGLTVQTEALAIHPTTREVYAGTATGVMRRNAAGVWTPLTTKGLVVADILSLEFVSGQLVAGTRNGSVGVLIVAANDAPVANNQTATVAEDSAVSLSLTASDPDAEPLTFSIVTAPSHGTLNVSGASVIYTPAANYHGPDSFTFKANDGTADSNVATVSITVTPVNDAPVALNDAFSTPEDTPATIRPVDNDSDAEPAPIGITSFTQPANGTVTQPGTHTLLYTPAANFFGVDSFTYTIIDNGGLTATATIQMTVTPVNDAPVAANGSLTVDEDTAGNGTVAANDVDTPLLTYTIHTNGAKGTAAITGSNSGAFTYTPSANANGSDSFVVAVTDGQFTVHATISVTINPVNDAPVATDGTLVTDEDVAATGTLTASDLDSSSLTFSIVANGSKGTVVVTDAATGAFTYTPQPNANGSDTFTFRVSDGALQSNVAIVHVTLNPVNDAPVAQPITLVAPKQTATAGQLIATDIDGNPLTYSLVQAPTQGVVTVAANGSFTYTSSSSASGVDAFTFKANDGAADSAPATASITILSQTGAPVAFDATLTATEDMAASGVLTSAAQAGRVLTYSINAQPAKGTVTITNAATGAFTYTPGANENGADSFTFRVHDGVQSSNLATISVSIAPVNDAPVATAGSLAVTEDRAESGILIGSDVDGQALVFELLTPPSHGTVEITNAATGRYTYTPNPNAFGPDTFTFRVGDGVLFSDATTVTVMISNVNDGPVADDVSFTTVVGTALAATLPASDPDGDVLTYEIRRAPRRGTLTIVNATTGEFIYTPNAGFSGTDTFTFRVSDGTRTSLVATVTITVRPN